MEDSQHVASLVYEWDDVYKKGQLSLWILLALYESKKYSAQIAEFMYEATDGTFEVKEQSLYRALRRFKSMKMVTIIEAESPNGGPNRKYYQLTSMGIAVLAGFIDLHIEPLLKPSISKLLQQIQKEGN